MMERIFGIVAVALLLTVHSVAAVAASSDQEAKMTEVLDVLRDLRAIPEESIPPALLRDAGAVAVIPNVVKVGLVIGGRYGKGVISVRKADGGWSDPLFLSVTGGSVGWQIGAQSTDVVLVFKSRKSIDSLVRGKFTLGADAAIAAGPLGRKASAATDTQLNSEIYSYSRTRGLFVGIALDGASLAIEHGDNARYYQAPEITTEQIIDSTAGKAPASATWLRDMLSKQTTN
ncbi:MAG: lipid-binding SYLF domain-containing protein [Candidatus Sedimenticola sp. 20ELBAFRAG]